MSNQDDVSSLPIYGLIYKVTNLVNSKVYIGQTKVTLALRWKGHVKPSRRKIPSVSIIHQAIGKYGADAFTIIDVDKAFSQSELDEKERYWIAFYRATEKAYGYNIRLGGREGGTLPAETRRRIGDARRGTKRSPESIKKQSDTMKKKIAIIGVPWKGKPHPRRKAVLCVETGEIFPSRFHATYSFHPEPMAIGLRSGFASTVGKAVRSGRTSQGFHWKDA